MTETGSPLQRVRASIKRSSEAIDSRRDRKSGKGMLALLSNSNWLLWRFQQLIVTIRLSQMLLISC